MHVELGDLWDDHIEGWARLVQWIHDTLRPSCIVVFSGDVHFGSFLKGRASMRASKEAQDLWSINIIQITSSPMKNEVKELRKTYVDVPAAEIIDSFAPTSTQKPIEVNFSGSNEWMSISFDAIKLDGLLTRASLGAKVLTGTMIFRNHICWVDSSKQHKITAKYFGSGSSSTGVVDI